MRIGSSNISQFGELGNLNSRVQPIDSRSSAANYSHMQNQLRHFESHAQVDQLASELHSYALKKLTQYYLILDSQL